ncbi:MAG: hypothetical protein M3220_17305 [Chloroflexota bacterium]|nr:hypothetical protein [Chloroflexota bacterium]
MSEQKREYTTAERVTLVVSLAIVLGLAGLVTYEYYVTGTRPAVVVVQPQPAAVRQEGEQYYLPVEISNTGDVTATDVWVRLLLQTEAGEQDAGEVFLATLPGEATVTVTLVFHEDPRRGTLHPAVSFIEP